MSLRTDLAFAALAAHLDAAPGLPAISRNDVRLSGFAAVPGAPGVGWKLALLDGDTRWAALAMGDPPEFELEADAEIILAVEGEAGATRDGAFTAAAEALAEALWGGDRTLSGAVEDIQIDRAVERDHILADPGAKPIETLRFTLTLILTAPTPFG
jgi:hypothetical protein